MSRIDVVLVIVVGLFAIRGFWRGFTREIFALIGLVGGVAVAGAYYPDAAVMLPPEVPEIARPAIGFLGVFVAVALAAKLVGLVVQRILGFVLLSPLDRLGGILFGAAKGLALIALGVIVVRAVTPPHALERACADSVLMKPLLDLTDDGVAAPPVRRLPDPIAAPEPTATPTGV